MWSFSFCESLGIYEIWAFTEWECHSHSDLEPLTSSCFYSKKGHTIHKHNASHSGFHWCRGTSSNIPLLQTMADSDITFRFCSKQSFLLYLLFNLYVILTQRGFASCGLMQNRSNGQGVKFIHHKLVLFPPNDHHTSESLPESLLPDNEGSQGSGHTDEHDHSCPTHQHNLHHGWTL